jgi:glycosyl transferase family 25
MNKLFSHVLVINLDKDTERLEAVTKQLSDVSLKATRIPAIYGAVLSDKETRSNTTNQCYNYCTPSMVGCWLSHKKAWEFVVNNNIESALILEDDSEFVDDFHVKLQEYTRELPEKWDIVLLGTLLECTREKCGFFAKMAEVVRDIVVKPEKDSERYVTNNLYRPTTFTGTHAYIVSRKGAEKLLQKLPLADGHVDIGIARHLSSLSCYAVTPSIIIQKPSVSASTQTINFPVSVNYFLEKFKEDNTSVGFMASEPQAQINGYVVNLWTLVFFLYGFASRFDRTPYSRIFILVILFLEFALKRNKKMFKQVLGSLICVIIGYLVAQLIFFST